MHAFTTLYELTERLEDVCRGLVHIVAVRLVTFRAVVGPFPPLLVARLAAVASPPVVALGNVHANVHSVVTCRDNTTEGPAGQITLEKGNYINPEGR